MKLFFLPSFLTPSLIKLKTLRFSIQSPQESIRNPPSHSPSLTHLSLIPSNLLSAILYYQTHSPSKNKPFTPQKMALKPLENLNLLQNVPYISCPVKENELHQLSSQSSIRSDNGTPITHIVNSIQSMKRNSNLGLGNTQNMI